MNFASEHMAVRHSMPATLEAILTRLEALSLEPLFAGQRQLALSRALRPYIERGTPAPLSPLPQEVELATLYLYADFYPEDGHLTLTEQLRDVVTEHIPEEERAWLDPLKHSSMDLLEVIKEEAVDDRMAVTFRSLGDGADRFVYGDPLLRHVPVGSVLLTRLIRRPDEGNENAWVLAGCSLVLSAAEGQVLLESVQESRRSLELQSGSFGLGEWPEFTKRYGHLLLWSFAQARFDALGEAMANVRYVSPSGEPCLYALAMYGHADFKFLSEGMVELKGFDPVSSPTVKGGLADRSGPAVPHTWVFRTPSVVVRLTLTGSQLVVECDSEDRLESVKHLLASTFGYALRFRKERTTPPVGRMSETTFTMTESTEVVVTAEEEQGLLAAFLEAAYLDWADTSCPALGGQTPRHAASHPATRAKVAALIHELEADDVARRRTGTAGFDYNQLRTRVGLEPVGS